MGFKEHEGSYYLPLYNGGDCVPDVELEYHTSWDWLMPVHKKCMFTKQFIGDDQLRTLLIDAVIDADIDRLYKAVVEFIKEYSGDGFKTSSELAENC